MMTGFREVGCLPFVVMLVLSRGTCGIGKLGSPTPALQLDTPAPLTHTHKTHHIQKALLSVGRYGGCVFPTSLAATLSFNAQI